MPYVYYHSSEQNFPASIESFGINWSAVTLNDADATFVTSYYGPSSLNQSAAMYSSVYEFTNGTARISYGFLHGFNNCGPKGNIYAKTVGIGVDETISVCPADKHWSDIEHISVYLKSGYESVDFIIMAFHQWNTQYSASAVSFNGNHPIVYSALGSHASYPTAATQNYYEIWSEEKKELGVKIYETYGYLQDYTEKGSEWICTNPRLLKLNGNAMSDISSDENYMAFKYTGHLGSDWTSTGTNDFQTALKDVKKTVSVFSSSGASKIQSFIDEFDSYFEANAPNSFADKGWF